MQTYVNSKIVLAAADPTFSQTLGASSGATHTDMTTTDGGKTWTIAKISLPAMNPSAASNDAVVSSVATSSTTKAVTKSSTVLKSATSIAAVSSVVTSASASPSVSTSTKHRGHQGHHTARSDF